MILVILLLFSFFGHGLLEMEENKIFLGHDGEPYNLEGFSTYRKFVGKLEGYFVKKVKNSYSFIFHVSQKNTSEFLSFVTQERFIFLQLLYSFSENDVVYGNLLLEVSDSFKVSNPLAISRWIDININFSKDEIYKIVHNVAKNNAKKVFNGTKSFADQLLYMDKKYYIFDHACLKGDADTVNWFLNAGFDLGDVSWKVLENAWQAGHLEIVKILLENNFLKKAHLSRHNVNKMVNDQTLLHVVAHYGLVESAQQLLSMGADLSKKDGNGRTPVYSALLANQLNMLRLFFSYGADVASLTNESGQTLLHLATLENNIEAVAILLDLGTPVDCTDSEGLTPLYKAVTNDNTQLIYVLAYRGANVNFTTASHNTLMHQACATAGLETVKTLIDLGAVVDEKNYVEETPLFVAARKKKVPLMKTLLNNGANIYMRDRKGRTLLHKAAIQGDLPAAEALIEAGLNVDARTLDGSTALYYAVDEGLFHVAKFLLSKGADPNAANNKGWSPLHRAAQWGYENIAILLLDNSAEPNVISQSGWTPLAIASHFKQREIENLIRSKLVNGYPDIDVRHLSKTDLIY